MTQAELDRLGDLQRGITTCTGCYWYRSACGVAGMYMMCHYLHDTGIPRGIRPADCYRHEGTPYRAGTYRGRHGPDIKVRQRRQNEQTKI